MSFTFYGGSAPEPQLHARERLKQVATRAAELARRYAPAVLGGALGWVCGYGLLGEQLKLSALPSPWSGIPASWLLPFQKGALTLTAEACQSFALPRGERVRWARRGTTAALAASILWQWQSLDPGAGLLVYGALMALRQFAPTQLWQRTRGLRAPGWWLLWLLARTATWVLALLLTSAAGRAMGPLWGWALGGALSGLTLVLFLRHGPQPGPPPSPMAVSSPPARLAGTGP